VNLLGNCVATFVVANWEGQLDKERMRRVLDGEDVPPLQEVDSITGKTVPAPETEGAVPR